MSPPRAHLLREVVRKDCVGSLATRAPNKLCPKYTMQCDRTRPGGTRRTHLKAVSTLKLTVGWSKYNQALGSGKTALNYTGLVAFV